MRWISGGTNESIFGGVKDGWYFVFVEGGYVGMFLKKVCFWGILTEILLRRVNGCEIGSLDGVFLGNF